MLKRSMTYKSRKYQFKKYYFLNWYFAALRSALSEITIAGGAIYRYMKWGTRLCGLLPWVGSPDSIARLFDCSFVPGFQGFRVPGFRCSKVPMFQVPKEAGRQYLILIKAGIKLSIAEPTNPGLRGDKLLVTWIAGDQLQFRCFLAQKTINHPHSIRKKHSFFRMCDGVGRYALSEFAIADFKNYRYMKRRCWCVGSSPTLTPLFRVKA